MARLFSAAALIALSAGSTLAQGVLLIPDSDNDRVMAFSAFDGSLINANFISDIGAVGWQLSTPIEAAQVGNEIWVSDQIEDRVHRFDLGGSFLSSIGNAGLDNIRGFGVVGNSVYVTNAGTANGAPGNALVRYDFSGNFVANVPVTGSTWDVLATSAGDLLVPDSTSNNIERYLPDGTSLGAFENAASLINFPQQIAFRGNGNLLAAGFSGTVNAGAYEFDSSGNQLNFWLPNFGVRGIAELGNGRILATFGAGTGGRVVSINPADGSFVNILQGGISARYINYVEVIPAPGSVALAGIAGLAATRRRRA